MHRLGLTRVTGAGLAEIGKIALGQCLTPATPNHEQLSDDAIFTGWFSKYPADMLELEAAAIDALARPWEGRDETPAERVAEQKEVVA